MWVRVFFMLLSSTECCSTSPVEMLLGFLKLHLLAGDVSMPWAAHGVLWDHAGEHASPGGSGLQKFHLSQLLLLTHMGDDTPPEYSQSAAIGRKAFCVFLQWDSLFSWCPLHSWVPLLPRAESWTSVQLPVPELCSLPPLYSSLFFCGCTHETFDMLSYEWVRQNWLPLY